LAAFERFRRAHPGRLRLVLVGANHMGKFRGRDVEYRGVVSDAEKFALMAGATALVLPSPYESFSLATLEAMAQRTPVLVNAACAVLAEHVRVSGGGLAYRGAEEFGAAVGQILADPDRRRRWGDPGRAYVLARYHADRVRDLLMEELTGPAAPGRERAA
jgi:glycosyltransferase involved in cell wall biosynthesis